MSSQVKLYMNYYYFKISLKEEISLYLCLINKNIVNNFVSFGRVKFMKHKNHLNKLYSPISIFRSSLEYRNTGYQI